MQRGNVLLVFIVASTIFYPLFILVVFILDSTLGANTLQQAFWYESHRDISLQLLSDWVHSLPVAAISTALIVLPAAYLSILRSRVAAIWYFLLSLMISAVVMLKVGIPLMPLCLGAVVIILLFAITTCLLYRLQTRSP